MEPRLFHFATISNKLSDYENMRTSMALAGFTEETCRFSLFDNSTSNAHDPYLVLEYLTFDGQEPYFILCHQDLRFSSLTTYHRLADIVHDLDLRHDRWSVAGTAGIDKGGVRVLHIDDPSGSYRSGNLPRSVVTLDENFLLVRRSTAPMPTPGLSGFHFYGADLCLNAVLLRLQCFVIDFPLTHLSGGNDSAAFHVARVAFEKSWQSRLWLGIFGTTCADFAMSANRFVRLALRKEFVRKELLRLGLGLIPKARRQTLLDRNRLRKIRAV